MTESVSLAHHWLVGMRGGEKVLEQLCLMFSGAPIYTLVAKPENLSATLRSHPIKTSLLQTLPGGSRYYKALLPLFPAAVRRLRVDNRTTFLFSTDASVIKGLSYPSGITHVCYCHSPPRYLWDLQDTYLRHTGGLGWVGRKVFREVSPHVRRFDYEAAQHVTRFIANSRFVAERISQFYGRSSTVIHPPVDIDSFDPTRVTEDFYLVVSELVGYKRIDLAVDAFNRLGKRLVIIGGGSEMETLRSRAQSNVEFLGRQPFSVVKHHFERCKAFVHPQIEDFGITAVEAQAAGRPVIAFRGGGALESVIEGETGIFFDEQSSDCLAEAVARFEKMEIDSQTCRVNAERFRPEQFRLEIKRFLAVNFPELLGALPPLVP